MSCFLQCCWIRFVIPSSELMVIQIRYVSPDGSTWRSGVLKTLPKDYVGERHVVIVKREPAGAPGNEWCEFEERPGPAPVDAQEDDCTTIYIIYQEREIPQWPKSGRTR